MFLTAAALTLVLAGAGPLRFVDEAAAVGVTLRNVSGNAAKRAIPESTGAGACFFDFDRDGDLDLYLANGGTFEALGEANPARDALYANNGQGRFLDVTRQAGINDPGWGGGCSVADVDNDGDADLLLTHFGGNRFYRNGGDGTFREDTRAAGLASSGWSLGAAFFDADRDGDLDLYVANYLAFDARDQALIHQRCRWKGAEVMCGPRGFAGEGDRFYSNRGDGTFIDASAEAGVGADALYGMGVVAGDVDSDGDTDLFVANDSQENLLWINNGAGRFQDQALPAGVALSGDGRQQAGMGADFGDFDGDLDLDLFVTNFSDDYHTLYRNDGALLFTDVSSLAGLDPVTRPSLGWGGGFFDADNDGDLDLFVASSHVYPEVEAADPATTYRQRNLLLVNEGGRYTEVGLEAGPGLAPLGLGQGAAFGDYDNDGDLDLAVVNNGEPPTLLRNESAGLGTWVKVRLTGRASNRDGTGARVLVTAAGLTQLREVRSTGGYLSAHDPRLHFGLGGARRVERLEVFWPAGGHQTFTDLPVERLLSIDEARGVVAMDELPGRWQRAPSAAAPSAAAPAAAAPQPPPPATPVARLTPADLARLDNLVQAGTRHIQSGLYERGIAAYREALARLPSFELAAASSDAHGFGDRERYRSFLASLKDNLGVGLMRAERLEECAAPMEDAVALVPERAKHHANLGLCHFHGRRFEAAIRAFEAAGARPNPPPGLAYDLGRALAGAGRLVEALAPLEAATRELPRPDPRGRDAEAWYLLGDCLADLGRYSAAASAFREALERVPGHQKALFRLAFVWRRDGKVAAAERAEALFRARQSADEAVRAAKRGGARTREERLALGRAQLAAGLAPQAVQEAEALLAAAGGRDAAAQTLLGEALLALRPAAKEAAADALRRALALAPENEAARAALARALGPEREEPLPAALAAVLAGK